MIGKNKSIKLLSCSGMVVMLMMTMSVVFAQEPPPTNDVIVDVTPESQTGTLGGILTYNVNLTNNGTADDIVIVNSITGVPASWIAELNDTGVPQILPYSTPLLASKTSYLLTLDVHIPANATTGATMTINIRSLADPTKTDTDAFDVVLGALPTPTPTPTPTPSVYRPGGGGARVPTLPPGTTEVATTLTGEVTTQVIATSTDKKATVTIPAGIIARDAEGAPLEQVKVVPTQTLPAVPPSGVSYVGYAYDFEPIGATFSEPIEISITFDHAKFEGKTPVIYTFERRKWTKLVTTVINNKATTKVDHFFTFVLFAEEKVVTPTPVLSPIATPTPSLTPVVTPTPTPTPTPAPSGFDAVFAVTGILAVAYLVLKRRK